MARKGSKKKKKDKTDSNKKIKKINRAIDKTNENILNCPNCDLPTFPSEGETKVYCANCHEYFSIGLDKKEKKNLNPIKPKSSKRLKIGLVIFAILSSILIISLTYYFVVQEDDDFIDIYDIEDVRGLDAKKDVELNQISNDEMDVYFADSIDAEIIADLMELEIFYKSLLIVEEEIDLVKMVKNQSNSGILGFYDTDTEELYVVGVGHSSDYINFILAHEFTHALQDQNYDLDIYMDSGGYDADLARLSAIEGDASITMDIWKDENVDATEDFFIQLEQTMQVLWNWQDLINMDTYYNDILGSLNYFPYVEGKDFVDKIYQQDGWEGVDALYTTQKPLSSEQVLHFDKYESYEPPIPIDFQFNKAGFEEKFTSSAGEVLLSSIISSKTEGYVTFDRANGWGGDKFFHYESDEDFLSVLKTAWDSPVYNSNFYDEFTTVLEYQGYWNSELGMYEVGNNYAYLSTQGSETTYYYSDSIEVIQGIKG